MTEYNAGDLVEAVKGDTAIRGRLRDIPGNSGRPQLTLTLALTTDLLHLAANGFTVTVIERATPPLPTEPGWYLDADAMVWAVKRNSHGDPEWFEDGGTFRSIEAVPQYAPFTRLEPVPVTAKRLIDRMIELDGGADGVRLSVLRISNELAAEFGVES